MAWTYSKISKSFDGGDYIMIVHYEDPTTGHFFDRTHRTSAPTSDWPDSEARLAVSRLNAVDFLNLKTGAPVPTPAPVPSTPPTDRDVFFSNYSKLIRLHDLVTHKILAADAKEVTDLEALVQSQYKPEYFT